jgi:hypothetical protein
MKTARRKLTKEGDQHGTDRPPCSLRNQSVEKSSRKTTSGEPKKSLMILT